MSMKSIIFLCILIQFQVLHVRTLGVSTLRRSGSIRCDSYGVGSMGVPQSKDPSLFLTLRGGSQPASAPKLLQWITPALSSAVLMALYSICIKVSSRTVHPILGGVILQLVAVLLGSAMLGVSTRMDKTKYDLDFRGALWSVCAGMAVGAAEIVSFKVSAMGVQASQLIPVMIGGSVAFGSVMGVVMLKERMTLRGWLGVFLVIAGIVFVATDPGANIGH